MLSASYDNSLVVISLLVAILASFTALDMAERVNTTGSMQNRAGRYWLAGGAFAMGIGIWSMHFVGMLAFGLPIALGYDAAITLLSLAIAIAVSAYALWSVSQPELPLRRLLGSALVMGAGIAAMHYTGMAALRMNPGIDYDPLLFAASVAIAVLASAAALWIAFRLRHDAPQVKAARIGASIVIPDRFGLHGRARRRQPWLAGDSHRGGHAGRAVDCAVDLGAGCQARVTHGQAGALAGAGQRGTDPDGAARPPDQAAKPLAAG